MKPKKPKNLSTLEWKARRKKAHQLTQTLGKRSPKPKPKPNLGRPLHGSPNLYCSNGTVWAQITQGSISGDISLKTRTDRFEIASYKETLDHCDLGKVIYKRSVIQDRPDRFELYAQFLGVSQNALTDRIERILNKDLTKSML